ncbi:MAG: hypothetical protein JOY73_06130 [Actinobacteria bacterium]|nr:hypothetical protein [Actinomycetota bacterium]
MSTPVRLAAAGMTLLVITSVLAFVTAKSPRPATNVPPPQTTTATATTTPAPPPATTTTAPAPPPPSVAMSWNNAGAFIVHTHDVDPTWLGQQLRAAGFGWVAVYLGSSGQAEPIDPEWVYRFILASGLPVGGWTMLNGNAHADAGFAAIQLKKNALSFYIADAEYAYQGKAGLSQEFVSRFRSLEPTITAGLSSLCNASAIGLGPWASAGFAFLPQAYVNDFGSTVAPSVCVQAATAYFPLSSIHPTVGSYRGQKGWVSPQQYIPLLAAAGTTGFSVYNAETNMTAQSWQAYGQAIRQRHIAATPS